jgi:hypothetical protein
MYTSPANNRENLSKDKVIVAGDGTSRMQAGQRINFVTSMEKQPLCPLVKGSLG